MLSKGFKDLLAEAQGVIDQISVDEALPLVGSEGVVFVDVREQGERERGYIPGSVHVPRGFLEFVADPAGPMHNPALASGARLVVYCASGARSALAAKTLHDMGLGNVVNLVGGIQGWSQGGGPIER